VNIRLLLVCEVALVDRRTNNLSLVNIWNELTPNGFPFVVPRLVLVAVFEREGDEESPEVILRIKQEGTVLFSQSFVAQFKGKSRTRHILEIHGLVVSEPKPLVFQLLRNHRQAAKYDLIINSVPGSKEITEA